MAQGDNRVRSIVGGKVYWHNPNTGKWFTSRQGDAAVADPRVDTGTDDGSNGSDGGILDDISDNLTGAGGALDNTWMGQFSQEFWDFVALLPTSAQNYVRANAANADVYYQDWVRNTSALTGGAVGDADEETPTTEQPEQPPYAPAQGYEWVWNGTTWTQQRTTQAQNDLFNEYRNALQQFGFSGTEVDDFLKESVREDWNESTFLIKLRQEGFYLANPLFAANIANAAAGRGFRSEGEVIAYATEAKRLAKQFGYEEPSDAYIAMGLQGGLSLAEYEHRFKVQQRINQFGGGVALVYEALTGDKPDDADLFEVFDNEVSTKEFDDLARVAEMRGRPLLLGLGIRSAEEQKALDMLGVTPDQAWAGYKQLADALPTYSRLAEIDKGIAGDDSIPFDSMGALFSAIFEGGPQADKARSALEAMKSREYARFRPKGSAATNQQGQLIGLLTPAERQAMSG